MPKFSASEIHGDLPAFARLVWKNQSYLEDTYGCSDGTLKTMDLSRDDLED